MAECHPCRGIYKQITTAAGINFSLGAIIWDNFRFSPGSDHCDGGGSALSLLRCRLCDFRQLARSPTTPGGTLVLVWLFWTMKKSCIKSSFLPLRSAWPTCLPRLRLRICAGSQRIRIVVGGWRMSFSWLDGFGGRTSASHGRARRLTSFGDARMYGVPSQSKGVEIRQVGRQCARVFNGV